jgi:dTDP-4-amino-4,6-dideoxygalactose transaminase
METKMQVQLLDLKVQYESLAKEILPAVEKVLKDANYIMGKQVEELEKKMCEYLGCKNAIAIASGTDALLLSLRAAGVGYGDEVVTTPYTFFATAGAIVNVGAKPVFVDIVPGTCNINPAKIEAVITKKTKAIIPVHLFGQSADMDPIMAIAKRHNLKVIEDACQSIGTKYKNVYVGNIGDTGCFSFFPSKNLGCAGDGGMVSANNQEMADKVRILRVHGGEKKYYHRIVGTNSRLDTIQAAILLVKIKYLDNWSNLRQEHADRYNKELKGIGDVRLPEKIAESNHVYNQYTIRTKKRDQLQEFFKENGIGNAVYYPLPLHLQDCFKNLGYKEGDFPESESAAKETVSIPVYPELTDEQQDYVIEKIREFYKK